MMKWCDWAVNAHAVKAHAVNAHVVDTYVADAHGVNAQHFVLMSSNVPLTPSCLDQALTLGAMQLSASPGAVSP